MNSPVGGLISAILRDPDGFVDALPTPAVLDEIQRAHDVLLSLKRAIDRERSPGSWPLTGSADVMTLSSVSASLAGRITLKTLNPFSWPEIEVAQMPSEGKAECRALVEKKILSGGYPPAAFMKAGANRVEWFDSCLRTHVERDFFQIKSIEQVHLLPPVEVGLTFD